MKVYRKNKRGFLETLYTVGSFLPKGWSRTKEAAMKKR